MGETAMMGEAENRAADLADDIQVGGFCGQREGRSGQRRLAIQPRSPEAGAGQKVSDWFQSFPVLVLPVENIGAPFAGSNSSIKQTECARRSPILQSAPKSWRGPD